MTQELRRTVLKKGKHKVAGKDNSKFHNICKMCHIVGKISYFIGTLIIQKCIGPIDFEEMFFLQFFDDNLDNVLDNVLDEVLVNFFW